MSGDPGPAGSDEGHAPVQPKNYLRPCLLLLLEEEPTYGYQLRTKLSPLSAGHWDPGTVYRTLNTMEDDGLVRSTWERSPDGPRRHLYEITFAGSEVLDGLARELCGLRTMVNDFIERYESHHHAAMEAGDGGGLALPGLVVGERLDTPLVGATGRNGHGPSAPGV